MYKVMLPQPPKGASDAKAVGLKPVLDKAEPLLLLASAMELSPDEQDEVKAARDRWIYVAGVRVGEARGLWDRNTYAAPGKNYNTWRRSKIETYEHQGKARKYQKIDIPWPADEWLDGANFIHELLKSEPDIADRKSNKISAVVTQIENISLHGPVGGSQRYQFADVLRKLADYHLAESSDHNRVPKAVRADARRVIYNAIDDAQDRRSVDRRGGRRMSDRQFAMLVSRSVVSNFYASSAVKEAVDTALKESSAQIIRACSSYRSGWPAYRVRPNGEIVRDEYENAGLKQMVALLYWETELGLRKIGAKPLMTHVVKCTNPICATWVFRTHGHQKRCCIHCTKAANRAKEREIERPNAKRRVDRWRICPHCY